VTTVRASSIGRKVKILLGGRIVDAEKAQAMGADAYARDAWDGIAKAKELMSKKAK
jgi:methanogenic corrinoid protein MtbC1